MPGGVTRRDPHRVLAFLKNPTAGKYEREEQTAGLDIQCLCRTLNAEVTTMIPSSYTVLFTYSHVRT